MHSTLEKSDTKKLLASFAAATSELLKALSLFNKEEINVIPFAESWTAGQVAEHLLKSGYGIIKVLSGKTVPVERRPDLNVEFIEAIFLDFTKKAKSSRAIWPSEEPKEKEKIIDALKVMMDKIREITATADLTRCCMDFPFPTLGEFTRWEWVTFIICHTRRHTFQIENIYKEIKNEASRN